MREWYFITHLEQKVGDRGAYEVQILDNDGRAIEFVVFDSVAEVGDRIPAAVSQAVIARPVGPGDYVDPDGHVVPPF